MKSLFFRDVKIATRVGGGTFMGVLFLFTIVIVIPFGIGPDINLLTRIGPAMLWIGALLTTLLGLDRLFLIDQEDGSLDIIRMSGRSMEIIVLIKCAAHWVATGLPIILLIPLLSIFLNLSLNTTGAIMLSLMIGTPALTLIGGAGAAITVALQRGGLLQAILIIPFSIPVLIFGVNTVNSIVQGTVSFIVPLLLLCALTLVSLVVGPVTAALALRNTMQ